MSFSPCATNNWLIYFLQQKKFFLIKNCLRDRIYADNCKNNFFKLLQIFSKDDFFTHRGITFPWLRKLTTQVVHGNHPWSWNAQHIISHHLSVHGKSLWFNNKNQCSSIWLPWIIVHEIIGDMNPWFRHTNLRFSMYRNRKKYITT